MELPRTLDAFKSLPLEERRDIFFHLAQYVESPIPSTIPNSLYGGRICKTPGVCGGSARIYNRRIPVYLIIDLHQLGNTEAELLEMYPYPDVEDIRVCFDYYRDHRIEILTEIIINHLI